MVSGGIIHDSFLSVTLFLSPPYCKGGRREEGTDGRREEGGMRTRNVAPNSVQGRLGDGIFRCAEEEHGEW